MCTFSCKGALTNRGGPWSGFFSEKSTSTYLFFYLSPQLQQLKKDLLYYFCFYCVFCVLIDIIKYNLFCLTFNISHYLICLNSSIDKIKAGMI